MARSWLSSSPTVPSAFSVFADASRAGEAVQAGQQQDELAAAHLGVGAVVLGAEADALEEARVAVDRLAEDRQRADLGLELAGGDLEEGRLAGAVGAEQAGNAAADLQVDVADAQDVAVPFGELLGLENGGHALASAFLMRQARSQKDRPEITSGSSSESQAGKA